MLSIVIPFYNESGNIPELFRRIDSVLSEHAPDYEIIGIDDGSKDDTFLHLLAEREKNPRIKLARLSRNFGKEIALSAGLQHARGDAVITMDADLQHPPELIPEFLTHWREGYKMVYAARVSASRETFLHTLFAKTFYWLFARMSHLDLPKGAGDFRLLDRRVVNALNAMPERTRFMKGLFAWVGFKQIGIPFVPPERFSGKSGFSFNRLWHFAIDGLAAFSTVPLRVWSMLGIIISALSLAYGAFLVIRTLVFGIDVPGYASLMVSTLFIGGVQLISLGVLGEYLGRVFEEVKRRPLYLVSETHGIESITIPQHTASL